jgi:hypothetical protein
MKARKREIQRRIAYEAARILTDNHSADPTYALHKASTRLGITDRRLMPTREEIESALKEQQRLFRGGEQQEALKRLRNTALQAMHALHQFNPLLVGPVYEGTADFNSHIRLYLYAPTPEDVVFSLMKLQIPWHEKDYPIKFSDGSRKLMPGFNFIVEEYPVELIVLPSEASNNPPVEPQSNSLMKGATTKQLENLLA